MVKAGPAPCCLTIEETGGFLKLSISAKGTTSGSAAMTGNDANKEGTVLLFHPLHLLHHVLVTVTR